MDMKKELLALFIVLFTQLSEPAVGQVYYTKNASVSFFSKTALEDISAENNQVISIINFATGELQFSLLNTAFHFLKAKMESDFNENFIESQKFPRSKFSGKIASAGNIDLTKDGVWPVDVTGSLNIHGVSRNIKVPATITVRNGQVSATAKFRIAIADYSIEVPSIVSNKVAETIDVSVSCHYQKK
jgi:hypothetical protein